MDTKQIAVILLIIAIVLSAATIVISLSVDTDFESIDCADRVNCVGGAGSADGNIALQILPPPENAS